MNKIIIYSLLISIIPATSFSYEGSVSAAQGWSDSAGFPSTYEKLAKATVAEIIEKKKGGFYDQWVQNNLNITNLTIGAQTNFTDSELDNVFVTTTNCGETNAITSVNTPGSSSITGQSAPCTVRNSNANIP